MLRKWDYSVAQNINLFISNSLETRKKINEFYNKDSVVVHPPIDCAEFNSGANNGNFFLVVSRLEPYKKVDLIIDVFNKKRLPLKIVGSGSMLSKLKKESEDNIEFLKSSQTLIFLNSIRTALQLFSPKKKIMVWYLWKKMHVGSQLFVMERAVWNLLWFHILKKISHMQQLCSLMIKQLSR